MALLSQYFKNSIYFFIFFPTYIHIYKYINFHQLLIKVVDPGKKIHNFTKLTMEWFLVLLAVLFNGSAGFRMHVYAIVHSRMHVQKTISSTSLLRYLNNDIQTQYILKLR